MSDIRFDWTFAEIEKIYHMPLLELIFQAATIHRRHFDGRKVQVSSLLSVKTGGCPEDCSYCPQAARYQTGVKRQKLMDVAEVLTHARAAKEGGASRMCLGAAWREVKNDQQFEQVLDMVRGIAAMDMEVCCTLGMLNTEQAERLKEAGLYAYNHNIDTSPEHYEKVITTRTYNDRLQTLSSVREAKLTVCSGGILGLGESEGDRIKMLLTLANLCPHPESVPINTLVAVQGTPLGNQQRQQDVPIWDLVRMIATTRCVLPESYVRLSAGRLGRSDQEQALCFLAGANSIFAGSKLLTTPNPDAADDERLFSLLGLQPSGAYESHHANHTYPC